MQIGVRADASVDIGTGHVMRCLTLAEVLRGRGASVHFVSRAHPGHLQAEVQRRGFPLTLLPPPAPGWSANPLGAAPELDAQQTLEALGGRADWLLADHYSIASDWESLVRPHVQRLLVIDDLADRHHQCDMLLDQNYSKSPLRYATLLPPGAVGLLGPRFALLSPEYRERGLEPRARPQIASVMVFFGGSDPLNLTARALQALADPALAHLHVDVVVGVNNPHRAALELAAAGRPRTRILGHQRNLAATMAAADMAIGAGGASTWERMCIGLPSIVVSIADNQVAAVAALAADGLILSAGHHDTVDAATLTALIQKQLEHPEALAQMAERGRAIVDGWGAERVGECMLPTPTAELTLRPAQHADIFQYFGWANDPLVRQQSIRSGVIDFAQHSSWFASQMSAQDSRLYVMLAGDLPVGQIRFNRDGDCQRINYSLDSAFRGRGWGARLVELGLASFSGSPTCRFRAEVKPQNRPSAAVFERLGFAEIAVGGSLRVFERVGAPTRCDARAGER